MSSFAQFTKWLRKKQIQIEVTFAVYMFTPWEKFAFCTFISRADWPGCAPSHQRGVSHR